MLKELLGYKCPLCGNDLFAISCKEISEKGARELGKNFCLVAEAPRSYPLSKCAINCQMICSKTEVEIYPNPKKRCKPINKHYGKIVKNFPIGLLSSGFQIA